MRPPTMRAVLAWLPAVLVWVCAIGICVLGACTDDAGNPPGNLSGDDAALADKDAGGDGGGDAPAAIDAGDDAAAPDGAADPDGGTPEGGAVVNACPSLDSAPTCPNPPVGYADVQPILQRRCVTCHYDGAAIWPLTSYQDNVDWADLIRPDLVQCTMPPPDSDAGITADEWMALINWLACGTPP